VRPLDAGFYAHSGILVESHIRVEPSDNVAIMSLKEAQRESRYRARNRRRTPWLVKWGLRQKDRSHVRNHLSPQAG
jgi:hypothetical protein